MKGASVQENSPLLATLLRWTGGARVPCTASSGLPGALVALTELRGRSRSSCAPPHCTQHYGGAFDPRSPSIKIPRTPISRAQPGPSTLFDPRSPVAPGATFKRTPLPKSREMGPVFLDPRSPVPPTAGFSRTPVPLHPAVRPPRAMVTLARSPARAPRLSLQPFCHIARLGFRGGAPESWWSFVALLGMPGRRT